MGTEEERKWEVENVGRKRRTEVGAKKKREGRTKGRTEKETEVRTKEVRTGKTQSAAEAHPAASPRQPNVAGELPQSTSHPYV